MKVAYFHGYGSNPFNEKVEYLLENFESVYAPLILYDYNPYESMLEHLKENPVDLIIGSSMGGWFAYNMSAELGIPVLLFNPAFNGRPIEIFIKEDHPESSCFVVLGKRDDVVDPEKSKMFLLENGKNYVTVTEDMGHRVSVHVWRKWVSHAKKYLESTLRMKNLVYN